VPVPVPDAPKTNAVSILSPDQERALKPKDSFKECSNCPQMIVVHAGSFMMGSAIRRYIPKNVFFLREEVLIYDAPESVTFPRMFFSSANGTPSHRHIFLLYPPASAGGESATFPRMFPSSARRF
jgi:hypothetical protein